jgi:NTE family protein
MTTAFVLSGGGALGAVQVGMMQAAQRNGLRPDFLVGSSAGALNAAYIAGVGFDQQSLAGLAEIWQGLRRQDVFPFSPQRHVLALSGLRPSLCSPTGLSAVIDRHLSYIELSDARIPVHVVATDVLSGTEVVLSTGDARSAVLASAAVPGILPPVDVDGRLLFDGAIADHAPVTQAAELGADRIVVLPTGVSCALRVAPRSAVGSAVHALTLLLHQRLVLDVMALSGRVDLVVLPPLCPVTTSATDFRWARSLIARAGAATDAWLSAGEHLHGDPARALGMHRHEGRAA